MLGSADGVVFVADSSLTTEENQHSFSDLRSSLRENGRAPDSMPLVIQLNKTDLDGGLTSMAVAQALPGTRGDVAGVPACAERGVGVAETLLHLVRMVWPTVMHERESLAGLGRDLPQLLALLRRRLQLPDDDVQRGGAQP